MGKIGEAITRVTRRSAYEDPTPTETTFGFGDHFRILFRWKGSIYRLVWKEFFLYMIFYVSITAIHDFALTIDKPEDIGKNNKANLNNSVSVPYIHDMASTVTTGSRFFNDLASFCSKFVSSLQMVLLLGFFTSTAMNRWFALVNNVPGTTRVTAFFVHSLKEDQPEGIQIVQQYTRWILLSWTLVFRLVCPSLKEAYPDLISLQNEGLIQEHERLELEMAPEKSQPRIVINWNMSLLRLCARRGIFYTVSDYIRNLDCLMVFKKSCNSTIRFAAKNIPSALIQVVSIAVYIYGLVSLMARPPVLDAKEGKWKITPLSVIAGYIPIANIIQFFLFYSWLKFGRIASNPFGEDNYDIDVKQLLRCHIKDAFEVQALYVKSSLIEKIALNSVKNPSHIWIDHASTEEHSRKRETLLSIIQQVHRPQHP